MIPAEVIKKVKQIEIKTRSTVNDILAGEYHSVFRGQGMEFSEVRKYFQGDDIRNIDWNVTARAGEPYVKKFVEERELTVMLLLDASASSNFGSLNMLKSEMAVELCALLAFSAIKNNDKVGLVVFTSDVELFIPPKKGKKHVLRVIREILCFKPEKKGTDIKAALKYLNLVQKKTCVTFLISDFYDSEYKKSLETASKHHDLISVVLDDRRDMTIPDAGLIELEDPETGELMLVDTSSRRFRNEYKKTAEKEREELDSLFKKTKTDAIRISTESDYVKPLVKFFKKREKML